jgi:hypothetical protein
MNNNQKLAQEIAKNITWSCDDAFEIAYALLTECNMHSEAEALKAKFDEMMADVEEIEA